MTRLKATSIAIVVTAAIGLWVGLGWRGSPPPLEKPSESAPLEPPANIVDIEKANSSSERISKEAGHSPTGNTTKIPEESTSVEDNPSDQKQRLVKKAEMIENHLQTALLNIGFSQYEIDLATREIGNEFRKGIQPIDVAGAVDRVSETLKLTLEKKREFNSVVLQSIGATSKITLEQWEACLKFRLKEASPCISDIGQDLARDVSAIVSNQTFEANEMQNSEELAKAAAEKAASACGESKDQLNSLFDVSLRGCK